MSPSESQAEAAGDSGSVTELIPQPEKAKLDPGDLAGKVAVVTGGGWNIGRAVAIRLARAGAQVVVCSRNRTNLEETVGIARSQDLAMSLFVVDVTDAEAVHAMFEEIHGTAGRVDILACFAGGFGAGQPVHESEPAEWLDVVLRNLYGTYLCSRAALPGMLERKRGDILTCAGGGAFFPLVGVNATAYASAKAAVCRFTDQLYAEVMDVPGIRINCMEPGMTLNPRDLERIEEEERATGRPHPLREMNHSPEDGADLAEFLLSPAARGLNGRILSVDEVWWRDPAKVREVIPTDLYRLRRNFAMD